MKNTVLRIFDLIKKGELTFMLNGISKRVFSTTHAFGLKRDLHVPFPKPEALIDIVIRPFKDEDEAHFTMDLQNDGLIEKNIPTCYVATTTEDVPCYKQWFMDSKENNKIKEFWGQSFPMLKADEALIESVFTIPEFRSKGIMPAAIDSIAEIANDLGVRYLMLFVEIDNIPSLKGCHRSGFSPYVLRTEKWVLFKRSITFEDVPNEAMDTYLSNVEQIN